jgi:hypothetical protein
LKRPLPQRLLRTLGLAFAIPAAFLAIASLPWRPTPGAEPPRVTARKVCSGPLRAGAGEARFEVPDGAPIAGFTRLDWKSAPPSGPVGARALVLEAGGCRVALVSAEILVVPRPLAEAVRERVADLALDGVLAGATHTHAGPGGYWDDALAEAVGLGPHDPAMERRIAEGMAQAIRLAAGSLRPARAGARWVPAQALVRARGGGTKEGRLTLIRLADPEGAPIAEVLVLGSHATLLGRHNRTIGGDWPGFLVAQGSHGRRLYFQGALGDQSAGDLPARAGRPDPASYARAVSDVAAVEVPLDPAAATALGYARAEVTLPPLGPGAVPGFLRPAVRTLLGGRVPRTATVSAVRLGPALLVGVPAEPVAAVAAGWRAGAGEDVTVVSLADDYLGYAETPERWEHGEGETVRTYLGPELAARLGEGVSAAVAAVR